MSMKNQHQHFEIEAVGNYCMSLNTSQGQAEALFHDKATAVKAFEDVWCVDGTIRLFQGRFYRTSAFSIRSVGRDFLLAKADYDTDGQEIL